MSAKLAANYRAVIGILILTGVLALRTQSFHASAAELSVRETHVMVISYDPNLDIALPALQSDGTIRDEGISSEVVLAHESVNGSR